MEKIEVTELAAHQIGLLRDDQWGEYDFVKSLIADSFTTLTDLMECGRDKDSDATQFADAILKVMYVIGRYNKLVDILYQTKEDEAAEYKLERKEENHGHDF